MPASVISLFRQHTGPEVPREPRATTTATDRHCGLGLGQMHTPWSPGSPRPVKCLTVVLTSVAGQARDRYRFRGRGTQARWPTAQCHYAGGAGVHVVEPSSACWSTRMRRISPATSAKHAVCGRAARCAGSGRRSAADLVRTTAASGIATGRPSAFSAMTTRSSPSTSSAMR